MYQAAILGESVDPKYASTAMASVQTVGDIGGAMTGVVVAGKFADTYDLQAPMLLAMGCLIAPVIIAKRSAKRAAI